MIENILRTTIKKTPKECNVCYISSKGNCEFLVYGLADIFGTVCFHEHQGYVWNQCYPKNNVFTIPTNYIDIPIDYIIYDDVISGFQEARNLAHYFQAPMLYLNLVDDKDIVPGPGYNTTTIEPNDIPAMKERIEFYPKLELGEAYFGVDIKKESSEKFRIAIDNFCDDAFVQAVCKDLPLNTVMLPTDRKDAFVLSDADLFVHSWNYPTAKAMSYLKSGVPVLYFPTESNSRLIKHNVHGVAIQDINNVDITINEIYDNVDLRNSISVQNKLDFSKYNIEKLAKTIETKVYSNMEFFKG